MRSPALGVSTIRDRMALHLRQLSHLGDPGQIAALRDRVEDAYADDLARALLAVRIDDVRLVADHLARLDHLLLEQEPQPLQGLDGRQGLALPELGQELLASRDLAAHQGGLDVSGGVSGDLSHHSEEFAQVPQAIRQGFFELGHAELVGLEALLELLAALLLAQARRGRLCQEPLLLLSSGLELLLAPVDLGALRAPALLHHAEELVEALGLGLRLLVRGQGRRRQGEGGEDDGQCDRGSRLHRTSSAGFTGRRRRSGAACLRAMRRPLRIAPL
jgi:hypothetical protein